jgi:hypothetical protein
MGRFDRLTRGWSGAGPSKEDAVASAQVASEARSDMELRLTKVGLEAARLRELLMRQAVQDPAADLVAQAQRAAAHDPESAAKAIE